MGWLGCTGQSLDSIFSDVERFCSQLKPDSKELIILNFSHCYVVHESGGAGGHECSCDEWGHITGYPDLYLSPYYVYSWGHFVNPLEGVFGKRKDNEFVILRYETDCKLWGDQAWPSKDFPIYNSYANTNHLSDMIHDQQCKLQNPYNHDKQLFVLSWTLTLTSLEAEFCTSRHSIIHFANQAKDKLPSQIDQWIDEGVINTSTVPNIIYTDLTGVVETQAAIHINSTLKPPDPAEQGYWVLYDDGDIYNYGKAMCYGRHSGSEAADIGVKPSGNGYWLLMQDGGINTYGDAAYYGHYSGDVEAVAIGIMPWDEGGGYYILTEDGGIHTYGAQYYGHHSGSRAVALGVTPTGEGYWILKRDGGINCYGDAQYYGHHSGSRAVALGVTPTGEGYWILNDDGGINCYGDADFYGHHSAYWAVAIGVVP